MHTSDTVRTYLAAPTQTDAARVLTGEQTAQVSADLDDLARFETGDLIWHDDVVFTRVTPDEEEHAPLILQTTCGRRYASRDWVEERRARLSGPSDDGMYLVNFAATRGQGRTRRLVFRHDGQWWYDSGHTIACIAVDEDADAVEVGVKDGAHQ